VSASANRRSRSVVYLRDAGASSNSIAANPATIQAAPTIEGRLELASTKTKSMTPSNNRASLWRRRGYRLTVMPRGRMKHIPRRITPSITLAHAIGAGVRGNENPPRVAAIPATASKPRSCAADTADAALTVGGAEL